MNKINNRKNTSLWRFPLLTAGFLLAFVLPVFAQFGVALTLGELTKELHLTDQQRKELTPIVEQRDKKIEALKANTSATKLQKLRKAKEIQSNFTSEVSKHLSADQVKKLQAIQAARREKILGE
jgi:plasmid maintenance system killer protein